LWADWVSVEALDFEPDSCVLELALSDDLADAVDDQLARARCAAVPRAAACLDYAVATITRGACAQGRRSPHIAPDRADSARRSKSDPSAPVE
jgi:hypothetical protein